MRERLVHLLRHALEDPDVVRRPAPVELAQAEVDVASDRDQRPIPVDEGDDRADEGVVDVGQVRGEILGGVRQFRSGDASPPPSNSPAHAL